MAIFLIFILMMSLITLLDVSVDLIMGMSIKESLRNISSPFLLMSTSEYIIVYAMLLILLVFIVLASRNKRGSGEASGDAEKS